VVNPIGNELAWLIELGEETILAHHVALHKNVC
jgi:hypothetical protein